jgi:hypothetical protein
MMDKAEYKLTDIQLGPGLIFTPEKSEWTMRVSNITYTPDKGKEPNWFHRKMQELILGFKWRKSK